MRLSRVLKTVTEAGKSLLLSPARSARELSHVRARKRASYLASHWRQSLSTGSPTEDEQAKNDNPLRKYFENVDEGPGIWKWLHYFNAYHQHLQKFVGQEVSIVEVGVYSGGSMPMWREYFGERCHVHGIDIQPECKSYENEHTTIHIGDQANRQFWNQFRAAVPHVDILIDDGGHTAEQQMVTLEEMLPHLQPGGVFLCEDIHGLGNEFTSFVGSLIDNLNAAYRTADRNNVVVANTPFQASIRSINVYPYLVVIEKFAEPSPTLSAPKHGSQWQPFLTKGEGHERSG